MTTTLKTWIKLKEGLESLVDSGTLEEAIEKLEFYTTANVNLMENWEHDNTISEICIGGHDNYKCLCGKQHLKLLHIFNVDGREDKYIIGSSCIDHIRRLREEYEDNQELMDKICEISGFCLHGEYALKHKACLRCGERAIRIGYDYKQKLRKDFCSDCLTKGDMLRCMDCRYRSIQIEKDYKGCYKRLCKRCWCMRRIKKPTTSKTN
jgi:hypothetical protein